MNNIEVGLESLLKERELRTQQLDMKKRAKETATTVSNIIATTAAEKENKGSILKAESNASLFDLMVMIEKLVNITMKDLKAEFIPDEGKIAVKHADQALDHPIIVYKLIERTPVHELKPRHREDIEEKSLDKNEARVGQVFGQKFINNVQFDIFASVYITAEQVMERFEELLFVYAGYFKKRGVSEIIFRRQLTDSSLDVYRQTMSVRSLQYDIETEKLITRFREKIQEIESLGL